MKVNHFQRFSETISVAGYTVAARRRGNHLEIISSHKHNECEAQSAIRKHKASACDLLSFTKHAKMYQMLRRLVLSGGVLLLLSVALALPREDDERNKEIRSPAIDNDDFPTYHDDQPSEFSLGSLLSGRVGKFFNDFLQFPATVFRFVSGIIANQPFAKLREEVRNLNISYPK